jgi:hypothetical protein
VNPENKELKYISDIILNDYRISIMISNDDYEIPHPQVCGFGMTMSISEVGSRSDSLGESLLLPLYLILPCHSELQRGIS